ncbi:MAG: MBL fold metallo-hydrolase [Spirochaetes bacterium]|nr:MBL fold metallo-hydrolase [Spirochaetota bacterium]
MKILRWQVDNSLQNYQYILVDDAQSAIVIDPLDVPEIRRLLRRENLNLRGILVTHEHDDHAAEAGPLQREFSVPVYSSHTNKALLASVTTALADGESIHALMYPVTLRSTPGHSAGHAAFEANGFLFSGDALFHSGCGHCRNAGANLIEHYHTLHDRLPKFSPGLILMPGHYYAARNLDFSLHVEPQNARALAMRAKIKTALDELQLQTSLRNEQAYNPFLRLRQPSLKRRLSALVGKDLTEASEQTVFQELRALRDRW